MDPPLAPDEDDGYHALVVVESSSDVEPILAEVKRYLLGEPIQDDYHRVRRSVRRIATSFLVWNDQ